jgi:hypothetical protein
MTLLYGDVRPEGKAALIAKLQSEGRSVAMVGDGRAVQVDTVLPALDLSTLSKIMMNRCQSLLSIDRAPLHDGINDAAALAQADVGIAMAGGVGAASEVASIVLLGDKLPQVVDSIELSKATFAKIKQNLGWAFAYNLIGQGYYSEQALDRRCMFFATSARLICISIHNASRALISVECLFSRTLPPGFLSPRGVCYRRTAWH